MLVIKYNAIYKEICLDIQHFKKTRITSENIT